MLFSLSFFSLSSLSLRIIFVFEMCFSLILAKNHNIHEIIVKIIHES